MTILHKLELIVLRNPVGITLKTSKEVVLLVLDEAWQLTQASLFSLTKHENAKHGQSGCLIDLISGNDIR